MSLRSISSCTDHAGDPASAQPAAPAPQRSATAVQRRRYDTPAWRGTAHQHAELLRAVLSEHPGARQAWADRLGISRQVLDDLIESERLYEGDVALLPTDVYVAYLDAVRELHTGAAAAGVTRLEAVTTAHRETSEALAACLAALHRGHSTPREVRLRELAEARASIDTLIAVESQS